MPTTLTYIVLCKSHAQDMSHCRIRAIAGGGGLLALERSYSNTIKAIRAENSPGKILKNRKARLEFLPPSLSDSHKQTDSRPESKASCYFK